MSLVWIVGTLTTYGQLEGWLAGLSLFLLAGFLALQWKESRLLRRYPASD